MTNRLLQILEPNELAMLGPVPVVELSIGQYVERQGDRCDAAYFLRGGVASIVAGRDKHHDVALIGNEGMIGNALATGDTDIVFDCVMRTDGTAYVLTARAFSAACRSIPRFARLMLSYQGVLFSQTASTAASNAVDLLDRRLVRLILMLADREGEHFRMTHERLSEMLSIRRPGVTLALQALHDRQLVRSARGQISVLDRAGLIEVAGRSYGHPEREYERLIGRLAVN